MNGRQLSLPITEFLQLKKENCGTIAIFLFLHFMNKKLSLIISNNKLINIIRAYGYTIFLSIIDFFKIDAFGTVVKVPDLDKIKIMRLKN